MRVKYSIGRGEFYERLCTAFGSIVHLVDRHIAAAMLPPDVVAAAKERGQSLDLWETVSALLHELQQADKIAGI